MLKFWKRKKKLDLSNLSKRGQEWQEFSALVLKHVEEYAVPQYGDKGSDIATNYKPEQALQGIEKYIARYGKNARDGEQTRDFVKMAHYAQIAYYVWKRD